MPASGKEAYTPLRGRLIVTNGYCSGGCAERRAEAAEQTQQMTRPQPVVQPEAAPVPRQAAVAGGRPAGPALRVVR
ncbi:hypothetical protein [Nonomuraea sp. SYSU D8015]|uniref:hypothetical protein n=1 Tax=Nonomuraea sp. SYSU D8015 TaxID=2593644 RepID=UPI0016614D66|nr:hypothetical protein [Nonomuraea sp. SYSU D8015]